MIQYLIILLIPFSIINIKIISKELSNIFYLLFFFYIVFFIGFRFEMGLDWFNYYKEFNERAYLPKYSFQEYETLSSSLNFIDFRNKELLYLFTLDISNYLNKNIIFFNLINSFIAISCIFYFASNIKNKWFAICLITPFIIFYGMDIVRQFTSLGIIMVGVLKLSEKKYFISLFFFILATMFHFSSIIFLSLYFYYIINNKLRNLSIWIYIAFFIIIFFFLSDYLIINYNNFIEYSQNLAKNYQSLGMIARFTLSLIPFFIFTFFRKRFLKSKFFNILNWFFYYYILLIALFFFENFSIILDRLLVFTLPFQILIYSNLIDSRKKIIRYKLVFFISSFYLIFGLSWLFFSEDNFRVYIPYKNALFYDVNKSFSAICSVPYYKCKLDRYNVYE